MHYWIPYCPVKEQWRRSSILECWCWQSQDFETEAETLVVLVASIGLVASSSAKLSDKWQDGRDWFKVRENTYNDRYDSATGGDCYKPVTIRYRYTGTLPANHYQPTITRQPSPYNHYQMTITKRPLPTGTSPDGMWLLLLSDSDIYKEHIILLFFLFSLPMSYHKLLFTSSRWLSTLDTQHLYLSSLHSTLLKALFEWNKLEASFTQPSTSRTWMNLGWWNRDIYS